MTTVVDLEPDRVVRLARRGRWPDTEALEVMPLVEFHAWIDMLESRTVPEPYWRKATGGQERRSEPETQPAPVDPPHTDFSAGIAKLRAVLDETKGVAPMPLITPDGEESSSRRLAGFDWPARGRNPANGWVSETTEAKERHFRGLLSMHMRICKSLMRKGERYLYVDLHAGPGHLEFQGRRFIGSPLIVPNVAADLDVDYEALHFEQDPETAAWLRNALASLNGHGRRTVREERCEDGFSRWLDQAGRQPYRYGLVYSDPIDDEIPHALLNKAARLLPRVDLLSYTSANQYKRRHGQDPNRALIGDHIASVDKKTVLIRRPLGKQQWTFILWSNMPNLNDWRNQGFYRLDSEDGTRILDELDLTRRQMHAVTHAPLPFMEGLDG